MKQLTTNAPSSLRRNTSGSFTLEASMILPWVFMLSMVVLLFSLFIWQSTALYYRSSIAAERAAYSWSNSAKDIHTGRYPEGQYDGLYWRLTDDALFQSWFGLASGNPGVRVNISSGNVNVQGSSAAAKLRKIGARMPSAIQGSLSYDNIGIRQMVTVQTTASWLPQALVWMNGQQQATNKVTALVVEPTEFLRTFDLIRYYSAKFKSSMQDSKSKKEQAAASVSTRQ
ncbi:MAG: pilus assembly protein [Candidatus Cohnella colombiensis]|uniref:Pilus assembly protein n=1 Tax=Candidatus Cohnella colombiensis TaxID=3121368 RepID=A0AA95F571_9BACL|nr:MAG: pilus assembly protein [Cohnella sp.]